MSQSHNLHWRRKLHAFLHDSPDKASNIAGHENRAAMIKALDQFGINEFSDRQADWEASAADRLPFPHYTKLSVKLNDLLAFNHPLGGASLPKGKDFASEDEAFSVSQKTRPFLFSDDSRASFICAWRFWRNWASDSDPRFTSLPADTRIPDHSIWHHMGVTSAFQGARPTPEQERAQPGEDLRPRLLLFSVGPVQDFIAAARSTRDLWSGSYLLSYLVSTTLATIAKDVGPDQIIFPNLLDQPLIDHHLCEEVYSTVRFDGDPVSKGLGFDTDPEKLQKLLTPSLPNRFLALLPARLPHDNTTVEDYAKLLVEELKNQIIDIATSVATFVEENPSRHLTFRRDTFNKQVEKLLDIHWQILPLPDTIDELIGNEGALEKLLPPDVEATADDPFPYAPRKAMQAILDMTKKCPPQYPISPTTGWGILNALIAWLHDGAKAQRSFDAWREGRWQSGKEFSKDTLNGKEEAVLLVEGTKDELKKFCASSLKMSKNAFKPGELLGASTLIKRLWHQTWLVDGEVLGVTANQIRKAMPMPNTRSIAAGEPFAQDNSEDLAFDEADGDDVKDTKEKYFAILALDGDQMGKWISGSKSPKVRHGLSPKAVEYYQTEAPAFLDAPRAVTPSWHLQFSEALGNFSLHAAQRIVEAFNGRLIYAGGDDVLAMLPATEALVCARALRAAFRGEKELNEQARGILTGSGTKRQSDHTTQLFNIQHEGYLQLHASSGAKSGDQAKLLSDPVKFPAIVPGPATDVSVGIAVAHFKAPLQDVVKAAQAAEKRAKRSIEDGGLGRGAVAISLFKRSGEILEWGCQWAVKNEGLPTSEESAGYKLLHTLIAQLGPKGCLNSRFPHKLEGLLIPYLPTSKSIHTDAIFEQSFDSILTLELDHCLSRNEGGNLFKDVRVEFINYWLELSGLEFGIRLTRFINLLRTAAWMSRGSDSVASPSADCKQTALF
jgi:CRISPR-associated protein Cmr2